MVVIPQTPAHAAYSDCPYGKVCLWEWPNGGGARWDVPHCLENDVPSWLRNKTSSVRTHANKVTLYVGLPGDDPVIGQWTSTNLSPQHEDRTYKVWVWCD
nr:peptidase inhibitor family I36 protein [Streptomyces sp. SID3343]